MSRPIDLVWLEDRIASVWEDLEYCLAQIGLDLDLDDDLELLTSAFWVSYYEQLSERSSLDEQALTDARSLAEKLKAMLPSGVVCSIQVPLAAGANATKQARFFLAERRLDIALEWMLSAAQSTSFVLGVIAAANSRELTKEVHRAVRRDASILGHASNRAAKARAIELYREGAWPSKDKAAEDIAKKVSKATRTVRGWLTGL